MPSVHAFTARKLIHISALVCLTLLALAGIWTQRSNAAATTPVSVDPGQPVFPQPAGATGPSSEYYNWSGYAATASQPFTKVTSTYTQPVVTCPVAGAWTVFWVGFDGLQNGTVEQSGTSADCSGKTPTYYAWWEMYPTNDIQEMPITVAPGDEVVDTVKYNPATSQYSLTVKDKTDGQHYTKTIRCAADLQCARQSAEWIVERPTVNGSYTPLADWNQMSLSDDLAADSSQTTTGEDQSAATNLLEPISSFTHTKIVMVDDPYTGETLATPGALTANGEQFTDVWQNAQ